MAIWVKKVFVFLEVVAEVPCSLKITLQCSVDKCLGTTVLDQIISLKFSLETGLESDSFEPVINLACLVQKL